MRFISSPLQFFLSYEYGFSVFGAIFGFLFVGKILTRFEKGNLTRYIDGIVLSFLFVSILGFFGTLLGGQVYGTPSNLSIAIIYTHPYAPVNQIPVFPLPIVYSIVTFFIFSGLYMLSILFHKRGIIGYLGISLYCLMILIFDTFSGKSDIVSVYTPFTFPQICAVVLGAISLFSLYKIYHSESNSPDSQIIS